MKAVLLLCAFLLATCAAPVHEVDLDPLPAQLFASHSPLAENEVPKLLERREPRVPDTLNGVESNVSVEVLVGTDGVVTGSRYVAGDERFYEAVARAVQGWRFEPYRAEGKASAFVVPYTFQLTWPSPRRGNIAIRYGR